MYQRSSVYVMTAKEGFPRLLGGGSPSVSLPPFILITLPAYVEGGPPTAIADRIGASFPIPYLKEFLSRKTREVAEADRLLCIKYFITNIITLILCIQSGFFWTV